MPSLPLEQAREIALANGEVFHLVAFVRRGKGFYFGTNRSSGSTKYPRIYDGQLEYHLHAEMDALRYARRGDPMWVMRFQADGSRTMAKPCIHCQKYLGLHGVRKL
jgi:deoxycytidylate deaminase